MLHHTGFRGFGMSLCKPRIFAIASEGVSHFGIRSKCSTHPDGLEHNGKSACYDIKCRQSCKGKQPTVCRTGTSFTCSLLTVSTISRVAVIHLNQP
jgi:hypothetical protein